MKVWTETPFLYVIYNIKHRKIIYNNNSKSTTYYSATRLRTNIVYLQDSEERGDIRTNTPDEIQNAVSATKLIKDRLVLFSDAKICTIYETYVRVSNENHKYHYFPIISIEV